MSALKAWAENDYGDGSISYNFYSQNIPDEQKVVAKQTRKLVESQVGRYSDFDKMTEEDLGNDPKRAAIHSMIFSRSLHVQWIQGSQDVAESSFFKINSQGTVLDKTEELLLRNRKKSYAIAARSIVRAGTGHKYWSTFASDIRDKIESQSHELNDLLFQPSVTEPIQTLDLPLGGTSSPVDALKMLIDIFSLVDGEPDAAKKLRDMLDDPDGCQTVELFARSGRVVRRITGNDASSLGLHPAVYFYNESGKHSRFLFLGVVKAISDAIRNRAENIVVSCFSV